VNLFRKKQSTPSSHYLHRSLCGVDFPHPALERGWLHGRQLKLAWDVDRIVARMQNRCWLSFHLSEGDSANAVSRPYAMAGDWPDGGFIEIPGQGTNSLEDQPRQVLAVYAATPEECERIVAGLVKAYVHREDPAEGQPRVGILNSSYDTLEVQRVPITTDQIVPREQLALFYGDAMTGWVDEWLVALNRRRYGLTLLSGAPGTGKTTLLRSLAQWLSASHMFYFMAASRFLSVESGAIVTFWADENRNSRLRKVLILEDSESILQRRAEDNREKVATLLNLTDGMMGDALGLQIICTLNCNLSDLDPALLRPGRLIGRHEFKPLSLAEARRLATHLGRPLPDGPATVAEIVHGCCEPAAPPRPAQRPVGFHVEVRN
jgi:hypothetical protein